MKEQTITIKADVITTLKGMDKVVTELKSGLSEANTKIDFTKGVGASVSKLVDKFKTEFSKFNQLTENNKLDIGNTKEALKSGKNLIDIYRELQRIIGDLNSLTVIDAKKLFPDAFDQKVENASKKLKDFSNNWNKISEKQLKLDQAKTELQVLTDKLKELETSLVDTNTLKVNTTSAVQKVEEMTNKVKELKSKLKEELKLKVDTIEKDLIKNKGNRDNLQKKLNRANSTENINTAGRSVRYKGATLSEWEKGIGKASKASSQQKVGAIKALQNYSNITNELDAVNKKIKEQEKEIENFKTVWASFDNIADGKLGKELAKMGFSTDEIAKVQKAMEATNVAISEQTNARQKLAEAEVENARIEKEINKTSSGISQKTQEIKQLEQTIEGLQVKIGEKGLKEALKNALNIDISDDLLKSEQGLESLKNQLNELDNKSLSELIKKLSEMGINTEQAKQYVEQLTGTMIDLGDSAKDINRANQEMEQLKNQVLQFFSIGNAVQLFKRAVKSAFDTVKELDATMTETAVVTDFTISDMWGQLPTYAAEANKLGAAINDLYSSTTLYYQQGLQTEAAIALGIETTKMARIANIEAAEATNLMTAALRGFNMEVNETNAQKVNDIYSELAAITAADTNEIGIAMSKTASIASSANMEFETTAALLSQIIETTREAPETAGTAMKTIIARFSEVKELINQGQLTGEDTEGEIIDVNKIQGALRSVGISMNEFFAGTEGLDDVLLKLASKWDTLDFTTQRYIATTAAGSRQQSRFIAMMSDYSRTQELVSAAYNSTGASQEQFEKTLDSLDAKLTKLKNAWDQFAMGLANNEFIKGAIDFLTLLLNTLNSIIDTISGGNGIIKSLTSLGIAFSVFKGIKSLLNGSKFGGSIISNLFGGKGKAEAEAGQIGRQAGNSFITNFKKQIQNVKDNGLVKGLFSKDMAIELKKGADFSQIYSGLDDAQKIALQKNQQFKDSYLSSIQSINSQFSNSQLLNIQMEYDTNGIDAANAKVQELGGNIQITKEMADAASQTMGTDFKAVANAAGVAGAAIMGMASFMESMGASDKAVGAIRSIGTALMTLPVIFNVVKAAAKVFGLDLTATIAKIPIIGWIATAISLFIALIGVISSLNETDTEKLERLEEQTKKMEEAASKAASAYDELKSSLESINDLDASLDNLVYGTEAWYEVLLKVNEQILNLIDKYPELIQYVTTGKYGELELEEQGQEEFKKLQQKRLKDSQQAALISKAYQTDFDLSLKKERFETQVSKIDSTSGELVGGKENAEAITKAFKDNPDIFIPKNSISYQGILDLINNGQIEQAQKIWEGASYEETKGYDWSQILNGQEDGYNTILSNWEGTVNQYNEELLKLAKETGLTASALSDMSSDINSYNLSVGVAEKQINSFVKNAIDTNLSEKTKKSQYANQVSTGLSNKSVEDIDVRADELQSNKSGSDNITKLAKKLQEDGSNIITSTDDSLETYKQVYQELSGISKEQIGELEWSKEDFANAIASYDIADKYGNNAENIIKTLDNISKKDKEGANEAAALLVKEFSSLNKDQIEQLKSLDENALRTKLDEYGILSTDATDEEIKSLLDQLGVEDFGAWIKDIQKTAEGSSEQFTKLSENFSNEAEEGYETTRQQDFNTLSKNKTFGESQNIADALNVAESETGREGFDFAKKMIEDIYNNPQLLEVEQKNLLDILSQGFETPKDIEDYLNTLQEFDPTITDEDLEKLQEQFKSAYNVIEAFNLKNFREDLKSTLDTIDSLKDRESLLFNDEEYKALVNAGANENDFMFNGQEWVYLGGSLDSLAGELQKNTSALLNNTLALLDQQIASGQIFADAKEKYQDVEGIDEFLSGGLTDADKIAEMYEKIGITSLTDPETNIKYNMDQLANDEDLLRRLYTEQATNYINLDANKNTREDVEQSIAVAGKTGDEVRMAGGTQEEQLTATLSTAKEIGLNNNELIAYRDGLIDITKESKEVEVLSKAMATEIAKDNMLMNQAVSELSDNWDTWSAALKNSNKNAPEYATALSSLRNNMKNMLGITADLSEKFLTDTKNMELMAKAAKGDVKAIEALRKEAAKAILFSPQIDFTGFEKQENILNDLINQDFSEIPIGTQLDDSYIDAFNELIDAGVITADEVNQALEAIGYEPQIEYEDIEVNGNNKQRIVANGGFNQLQPDGTTKWIPIKNETELDGYAGSTVQVPVINGKGQKKLGGATFKGAASKTASPSNKGSKGGGGGGGGSKKEDTKTWKNPYDKFYNTTEKINELLRDRNNLEREYDKLLSRNSTTVAQLNKNLDKQLKNLEDQIKSQKVLISGKRKQLTDAKNATMEVAEGKTVSFQQKYRKAGGTGDISQYGYYDEKLGQIVINWDKLEALQKKDAEQGEAVEAYIGYLEGIASEFEDAQDALLDIEDSITEIINQQLEERVDFIETMRDLLVEQYQKRIDELSSLNDTINDSNQKILDGISESIELERQIRDNTKTEEDIADKEARLAYLRRDTSGANDLEIKQLEEELADMREGYSDTLIDQEIDRLTKQNDEAAEARQKQIEIMQAQLDYWQSSDYFNDLIESMDKNEATALWKELKDFEHKTEAEKITLMKEFNEFWNKGSAGNKELAAADSMYQGTKYTLTDAKGNKYSVSWNGTAWTGKDKNGKTFSVIQSEIDKADINNKTLTTAKNLTSETKNKPVDNNSQPTETYPYGKASETSGNIKQGAKGNAVKAIQYALNKLGYGNSGTSSVDGIFGSNTAKAVRAFQKAMGIKQDGIVGKNTREKFKAKKYLTGGLADYTGLAWLDGSKSKPELVLNAKDTENFIVLKDVLSDILKGSSSQTKNSGDNYYDFHITVEEIANDYDVEKMIQKIKEEINNDARYRNVNAINLLR